MTEDARGRTGASRTHAPRAARSMALALAAVAACAPGSPPAPAAEPLVATAAPAPAAQTPVAPPPVPADLRPEERAVVDLFEETSPSVVYITTLARRADWFGRSLGEVPQGTGTGFVWDDDGHVITNAHVIAGRGITGIEVVMSDQTTYEAEFVGASASHDLAVLRIDVPREALRPIAVGDSDRLRVGQSVLAIGNPFGLSATLTTGIVSALGRRIEGLDRTPIEDVIQTDAAINQGNSGGPLLDSAGRVIGVNTQIFSPSGASAGVGFAVPVNTVRRVVPQLIETGVYRPPQLGIQPAPPELRPAAQDHRRPGGGNHARLRRLRRGPAGHRVQRQPHRPVGRHHPASRRRAGPIPRRAARRPRSVPTGRRGHGDHPPRHPR